LPAAPSIPRGRAAESRARRRDELTCALEEAQRELEVMRAEQDELRRINSDLAHEMNRLGSDLFGLPRRGCGRLLNR
jgi:hypothetical protein